MRRDSDCRSRRFVLATSGSVVASMLAGCNALSALRGSDADDTPTSNLSVFNRSASAQEISAEIVNVDTDAVLLDATTTVPGSDDTSYESVHFPFELDERTPEVRITVSTDVDTVEAVHSASPSRSFSTSVDGSGHLAQIEWGQK